MATTEQFFEHAVVADGASDLFARVFGPEAGHARLVYGVHSLPLGAPVIVDTIFEIERRVVTKKLVPQVACESRSQPSKNKKQCYEKMELSCSFRYVCGRSSDSFSSNL